MTETAAGGRTVGLAGGSVADHAVMRQVNRGLVLDHLRRLGVASRSALADATGLAKPTVSLIVDELVRTGLVSEVGRGESGNVGGRPPVLLTFNARSSYLVAIHVGVRRTTVTVADALGTPIEHTVAATPRTRPAAALKSIAQQVRTTLESSGADPAAVAAVAVCLPGLVRDRSILTLAPNLGWKDVPFADMLAKELGAPVAAYNAAHTSLVAERIDGAARGADDVLLIYAGTGVGAAAYVDGNLLHGAQGVAGEFGHVPLRLDGKRCNCGKVGCLETELSADALAATAREEWTKAGRRLRGEVTAAEVAEAAAAGDDIAQAVLHRFGSELGRAAAWLVNVLDPTCVVLAGGVAGAGPTFVEAFADAVHVHTLPDIGRDLRVVPSALGQEAEVRGALLLAREHADRAVRIVTR